MEYNGQHYRHEVGRMHDGVVMMVVKARLKMTLCWLLLIIQMLCSPVQAETSRFGPNNYELAEKVFASSGLAVDAIYLEVWVQNYDSEMPGLFELDGSCQNGAWNISGNKDITRIKYVTTDVRCAAEAYDKLTLFLDKFNCHEPVGVTFRGSIGGELSCPMQHKTAQHLANSVQALCVEGVSELNMSSSCFYTGIPKKYLTVNERRIDLNIASRYDKKDHTTTLYVASPLIYQDY